MKRKTTKHNRTSRQSILRARIVTKRTVWFGFLKYSGKILKIVCVLGLIAGAAWGVRRGIEHAFYKNPDFRLKIISLNPNPVIDEIGVATAAGIDLTQAPNLFEIDVNEVTRKLNALPEIADARVERHPPGTLFVSVMARPPVAWISCPDAGLSQIRQTGAMLVDLHGFAYACPPLLTESAASLPVIELPLSAEHPIKSGASIQQSELQHCFHLLEAAREADSDSLHRIDSVRQVNAWSLMVKTHQGTVATFSLGDHARQFESLRAALDHAGEKGYSLDTINLIPKYNIPITIRDETPPKAKVVSADESPDNGKNRRTRDLHKILNRN